MNKQRVLFISRRFPPSKGGMERYAADLSTALASHVVIKKIVWTKQSKWLSVAALPLLFFRALAILLTDKSIDIIHSQDALTTPLAWVLSGLFAKPYVTVVHGLDITYGNPLYQATILPFVRRAKLVIANSTATADAARVHGVRLPIVITPGVDAQSVVMDGAKSLAEVGLKDFEGRIVLLTVGRLVPRKGVRWFIDEVLPSLVKRDSSTMYAVVGDGPDREAIEAAIKRQKLEDNVRLLGKVDEEVKQALLARSHLFVMPNIKIKNDMEGFGIVAHEAALARLPLVASRLEGIADAVSHGENGLLVPAGDAKAYVKAIEGILSLDPTARHAMGERARHFTLETYDWKRIAGQFTTAYESVVSEVRKKRRFTKPIIVGVLLAVTILVVGYYIAMHPEVLVALRRVSLGTIIGVLVGYAVAFMGLAIVLYYSVRLYDKRVSLSETFLLNAYSSLVNFFGPGQSGSGIRAVYLKVKHGLLFRHFVFATLIYYAFYAVFSVLMLLAGAGLWIWAALGAIAAGLLSWWILRVFSRRDGKTSRIVRPQAIIGILIGTLIQIMSLTVVFYFELTNIDSQISLGHIVSYTGGANLSLFIALTPGAIGIREALLVLVQSLHHVDNTTIVAAGVIDRAIYLLYLGILFIFVSLAHGQKYLARYNQEKK